MGIGVNVTAGEPHPLQDPHHLLIPLQRVGEAALAQRDRDNVPHGLARVEGGIGVLKDDLRHAVKVSRNERAFIGGGRFSLEHRRLAPCGMSAAHHLLSTEEDLALGGLV